MKKLFLILILNSSFCILNYSQQYGWIGISNNRPNSAGTFTLSNMHWISNNEGWICSGIIGGIYHTTDGRQTFTIKTDLSQ